MASYSDISDDSDCEHLFISQSKLCKASSGDTESEGFESGLESFSDRELLASTEMLEAMCEPTPLAPEVMTKSRFKNNGQFVEQWTLSNNGHFLILAMDTFK